MNEAKSTRLIDYLEHIVQAIERIRDYKEILAMLGELTPLEQTRAYREIVEENKPLWLDEGRQRSDPAPAPAPVRYARGPATGAGSGFAGRTTRRPGRGAARFCWRRRSR